MDKKRKGDYGEAMAALHLRAQGYAILARRYRTQRGEIDLIAKEGETVVFAEVKARSDARLSRPCEAVDGKKQQRLRLAAEQWLAETGWTGFCRFDVIEVFLAEEENGLPQVNQIVNAF